MTENEPTYVVKSVYCKNCVENGTSVYRGMVRNVVLSIGKHAADRNDAQQQRGDDARGVYTNKQVVSPRGARRKNPSTTPTEGAIPDELPDTKMTPTEHNTNTDVHTSVRLCGDEQ